jgi:hypothetical protein
MCSSQNTRLLKAFKCTFIRSQKFLICNDLHANQKLTDGVIYAQNPLFKHTILQGTINTCHFANQIDNKRGMTSFWSKSQPPHHSTMTDNERALPLPSCDNVAIWRGTSVRMDRMIYPLIFFREEIDCLSWVTRIRITRKSKDNETRMKTWPVPTSCSGALQSRWSYDSIGFHFNKGFSFNYNATEYFLW